MEYPFRLSIDRLRAISDVVMGVVFVALVLNIDIPDLSHAKSGANLVDAFVREAPTLFSFVISFLVVAKCWQIHSLLFQHIRQVNSRVLWLTMFYLLTISFVVFTSGLDMRFDDRTMVTIFSVSLMLPAMLLAFLCVQVVYAWRADETVSMSEHRKRATVMLMLKIFLIPVLAMLSVALTYYNVRLAYYIWSLILVVIFI